MLNQQPERLHRELCSIDELAVAYAKAGRRWPLWRQRLVLVHGSGCSADSWRYQVDYLSRDFEVVAPDLPGHGGSEPVDDPSVERYAATVLGVLQRIGRRKAFLAGHSMGGAVALQIALTHPELLKGLILIASAAYLDKLAMTPDIFLWAAAAVPHKFKGMFFSHVVTEDALAIAGADVRRCRYETVLGDFTACRHFDFRGRLKGLNLPTLILCGDEDHITPARYSKRLQQEIPGSTLMLVQKAGHMLPLESPDRVNTAIRDFIRKV
ncbi:MAG: alpha/beta hydrolase [Acidobacteria bacterium]|nr:alpha/beta hydrolase [Acidobacteriota bacterium]